MTEAKSTKTTDKPVFWVVVIAITIILGLIQFDIISVPSGNEVVKMQVYMSGEPADITAVAEKIELVEAAACSGSEVGIEIVKKAVISMLRLKADEVDGDAIVDASFSFTPHESINSNCLYPVSAVGMAVALQD
ncbi:MAG: hypothetical protein A6F71_01895 [Cycloclasticus sp. symbiont of Poecilosclerida sp. M]|nr:MAG: hypothetical protein A6F71_01895 [Cycloclasticus sp. symbiont of Poecilosclerida sp. M]